MADRRNINRLFKNSYVIFFLITLFSLIIWWSTKNLPYHWDSADFVINAAKRLQETNFNPWIADHSDFAHPPLFPSILVSAWKIFGESIFVSHLVTFPFLPILLTSTYLLGKKLINHKIGIVATVILGITPFILAEYGQVYLDLPSAALATAGFTAWFYNRYQLTGILFTFAGLIKFPVLLLLLPIFFFTYKNKSINKKNYNIYIWISLPIIISTLWIIYHFQETGWLLHRPERPTVTAKNIGTFFSYMKFIMYALFIHNGRWAIGAVGLISLSLLYKDKKINFIKKPYFQILIVSLISVVLFFSYVGEFTTRYGMFIYPVYILVSLYLAAKKFSEKTLILFLIGVIAINIYYWHPAAPIDGQWQFRHSEDLSYKDIIAVHRQAAAFIENYNVTSSIYGGFAQRYQLTQPYQGYVKEPQLFFMCQGAQPPLSPGSIIYLTPFHYSQLSCLDLIQKHNVQPLKVFEQNGYKITLFEVH